MQFSTESQIQIFTYNAFKPFLEQNVFGHNSKTFPDSLPRNNKLKRNSWKKLVLLQVQISLHHGHLIHAFWSLVQLRSTQSFVDIFENSKEESTRALTSSSSLAGTKMRGYGVYFTKLLKTIWEEVSIKLKQGVPPQLSGFVRAFHPAAPGSIPKHTIYAFSI